MKSFIRLSSFIPVRTEYSEAYCSARLRSYWLGLGTQHLMFLLQKIHLDLKTIIRMRSGCYQ